jgi:hypothetical protein
MLITFARLLLPPHRFHLEHAALNVSDGSYYTIVPFLFNDPPFNRRHARETAY